MTSSASIRRLPGVRFEVPATALDEALPRMDIAFFVGFAPSGPLEAAVPVESIDEHEAIFGEGGGREAADTLEVPLMAQVPLVPAIRAGGDEGVPIVVRDPDAPASASLREAAEAVRKATKSKLGKPLSLMATPAR